LRYLLINKQVEHIVGLPRDAIVGKTSSDLFSSEQSAIIDQRDRHVLDDPDRSVHASEQAVETPGHGIRTISTKRIVVRDSNDVPAYLITMTEDVTEIRKAEKKIRYLAMHDTLTGLFNRTYFHEQLETCLANTDQDSELALILIDLDGFKEVNDTFGHAAGDEVLRITGERLGNMFCDLDMVARLGGDEFAVLCRSASCHLELQTIASNIIANIQLPIDHDGCRIRVGATAGLAITRPGELTAATILRYVDIAMYEAKDAGKGNFCFFDLGMMARRMQRKQLELDMVDATSRGEFELHYQPIVDPRTHTVRSLEALLRWNHPERGMISPLEFIPIAEETGLILPIGEYVLEMACRAVRQWPSDIRISVNLSPVQFRDRKLASKVLAILEKTGMEPKRLELEITEAALLDESEENMSILAELRKTGMRIVMDDFGTGYSSLNYLRSFPFDKIKIDRSYIKDLVKENGNSLAIVQAVLALAAGLSLTTTAEGVETREQLDILHNAGCDEIQGYFFSKPLPAADIPALIVRIATNHRQAA
jgi:diguanylate cyclase (GGDEF)-like protein/PAS domain S-box-containing protein